MLEALCLASPSSESAAREAGAAPTAMLNALGLVHHIVSLDMRLADQLDEVCWRALLVACGRLGGAEMASVASALFRDMRCVRPSRPPDVLTYGQYCAALATRDLLPGADVPSADDASSGDRRAHWLACAGAHAIAILTEWDMFKTLDFQKIYDAMQKPAFLFDGRNIIDHKKCSDIGFNVWAVGKSVVTPGFA